MSAQHLWLARLVTRVRLHEVRPETRAGRPVWVKHRRPWSALMLATGSVFLQSSRSRIAMPVSARRWQQREQEVFEALHAPARAGHAGTSGVWMDALPGESLETLAHAHRLDERATAAAGAELARAHQVFLRGLRFSHGDPHLGNFLLDHQRARLIDFETLHEPGQSTAERQADDLLVFLLDLSHRIALPRYQALARAFLAAYADQTDAVDVLRALRGRLVLPVGLERVLWASRSGILSDERLAACLHIARQLLTARLSASER